MLPKGYTRVEYIESTGTQYIDTGFKPNQNTRIVMDAIPMSVGGTSGDCGMFFGSGYPVQQKGFEAYAFGGMITGVYNGVQKDGSAVSAGQRVVIDFNKNVCKITADGKVVLNHTFTAATFTSDVNLALFVIPRQSKYYGRVRAKSCQIYDNGTLVRDYIPCRNPDGEAGLYDMVGGRFYDNDGTGEFVCGRALALPEHYKRLSYIESTGTQYIDTGFKPNQDTRVVMRFQMTSNANSQYLFGCRTAEYTKNYGILISSGIFRSDYSESRIGYPSMPLTDEYTVDKNKNVCSIGSATVTNTAEAFSSVLPIYLFACNEGGSPKYFGNTRSFGGGIYDSGTLVRDYIPCQTDTGEVGLYDMATATFYGNDGTGEFIAGLTETAPNAPEFLEYTQDGGVVSLTWSASSGAETYHVYRDGALIVETEATEYTDTVAESPAAHLYAVTAINEFGESALSESVRADIWGDTAPELIYDRTQADVDDAKALISKYMRGEVLDGYEQELWERGLRGCYNTSDVNRVEYHTRELQNILNANGYNIQIDTRLWSKPDIMRYSDIVRYLGNINAILDAFGRSANAPKLPGIDRWIDYIAANDIEKILYVTRELIYGALAMFRRAGTFRAGGDYLAQVIRRA